mmetsp:Transcript_15416/g.25084  ORF Transcript_15416/g.25084 Transcript_15416/m.25084 type:complete len:82 (-) Transcript_15416:923-1168(-)
MCNIMSSRKSDMNQHNGFWSAASICHNYAKEAWHTWHRSVEDEEEEEEEEVHRLQATWCAVSSVSWMTCMLVTILQDVKNS